MKNKISNSDKMMKSQETLNDCSRKFTIIRVIGVTLRLRMETKFLRSHC